MRKFKTFEGSEVNLDNSKTYKHLPQNTKELRQLMWLEIGYTYCYMSFWYKDIFKKQGRKQKKQVKLFIKNFIKNEEQNYENVLWYQEQIFLFQNEIENMC